MMQNISQEKKDLFETTATRKAIASMAVPTIISQLINLVYNLVDTYFIGRTGDPYMLAGVSVSFTLFVMTTALSNLFGIGGGSQMSRLNGICEFDRARNTSSLSFYACILTSLLYSALIFFFMDPILILFGASEKTIVYGRQYLTYTVIIGSLPTICATTLAHQLRNQGYSKKASIGLSIGGLINIIADPLFMFVIMKKGDEVKGAAIATLLSNTIAYIYLLVCYCRLRKKTSLDFNFSKALKTSREDATAVLSVGVPAMLLTALFDIANIVLNHNMAAYGDFPLAAIGMVLKIERLPQAICIGLCQGVIPLIAYNFSMKNYERMNEIIHKTRIYGFMICAVCIAFFQLFTIQISKFFLNVNNSNSANVLTTLEYAIIFLRIRSLSSPLLFINYHPSFTMQAMGDGRDTLIHVFVRELVFYIPSMLIMDRIFGIYGLVSAVLIGELCGGMFAAVLLGRFIKTKMTIEPQANVNVGTQHQK